MALYKNEMNNSIVFNEEDFDINRNYIPDWFMAIGQLDKNKTIEVAIDMPETPVIFLLYLMKVLKETPTKLNIYHKEDSETLKIALKGYRMAYRNIKKFPFKLPSESTL